MNRSSPSSAALAAEWDAALSVCWEPEPIAPAAVGDLFDSRTLHQWMSSDEVAELCGVRHQELPRYLTHVPERSLVVLAGHDRGEQVFIPELLELVNASPQQLVVVIIAGGTFGNADEQRQQRYRHEFYRRLPWNGLITERVESVIGEHSNFLGLHIRQTDRSRQAPTSRQVIAAVQQLKDVTGLSSMFVAADTAPALVEWQQILGDMGLHAWTAGTSDHARDSVDAGIAALVEWQVLGRARGLVFSAASSFGAEAAVAAGDVPVFPLSAQPALQRARAAREWVRSGVTYPLRHGPFARS
ncbi:MAG TPA: hypothetical protein VIG24_09660 [Acidimicrobiia bacterium]